MILNKSEASLLQHQTLNFGLLSYMSQNICLDHPIYQKIVIENKKLIANLSGKPLYILKS